MNRGTIVPALAALLLDDAAEDGALLEDRLLNDELLDFEDDNDDENDEKDDDKLMVELADDFEDALLGCELLLELIDVVDETLDDDFELKLELEEGITTTTELARDDLLATELLLKFGLDTVELDTFELDTPELDTPELDTTDALEIADDVELVFALGAIELLATDVVDGGVGVESLLPPPPPPHAVIITTAPSIKLVLVTKPISHHLYF